MRSCAEFTYKTFLKSVFFLVTLVWVTHASASTLTFTGQNANLFSTANPNDTTLMLNNVVKPSANTTAAQAQSSGQLIFQSVVSQLSSKIYSSIFNTTSGSYSLGNGQTISWQPDPNNPTTQVQVTITNSNGSTTVLSVSKS